MRAGRRARAITATVVVALFTGGAIAIGAGGVLKNTATVPEGDSVTIPAVCKPGEHPDVGGFLTTIDQDRGTLSTSLLPTFRSWKATFYSFGDDGRSSSLTTCSERRVVGKNGDLKGATDGPLATSTVRCPRGTRVQLGGYDTTETNTFHLVGLRATSDRVWSVTARTESDTLKIVAMALCGKGPALKARSASSNIPERPFPQKHVVAARCKTGEKLGMAGFRARGQVDGYYPYGLIPDVSGRDRVIVRSWAFEGVDAKVTAIAYCS